MKSVFICGCGHSGTSLLANMFAAHPEVFIPLDETQIFLKPPDRAADLYEELVAEAEAAEKSILAEKTPKHIRHLDVIRAVAADHNPRFVLPVRDGRDVVASIARRSGLTASAGVKRWIKDSRIIYFERARDDVCVYRHEDLVAEPESTLRKICDGVEIPFDPAMLNYYKKTREWFKVDTVEYKSADMLAHAETRNQQINKPIFDSSGRWRDELEASDLEPLEEGPGLRLMKAFRYT